MNVLPRRPDFLAPKNRYFSTVFYTVFIYSIKSLVTGYVIYLRLYHNIPLAVSYTVIHHDTLTTSQLRVGQSLSLRPLLTSTLFHYLNRGPELLPDSRVSLLSA